MMDIRKRNQQDHLGQPPLSSGQCLSKEKEMANNLCDKYKVLVLHLPTHNLLCKEIALVPLRNHLLYVQHFVFFTDFH